MTYNFLSKKGPTLAFALVVVCVVIALIPILIGLSDFSGIPVETQSYSEEGNIFLAGIYISIGLLVISTVIAILLAIFQVVSNPKDSIKILVSFGILAAIFFILYAMADPVGSGALATTIQTFGVSHGISKLVSGGIQLAVIMLLGSVIITILMEIWIYFKNQ